MTFYALPTLLASPTTSARETVLASLARLAGVDYPKADTSALDAILNAPTAREVMMQSARTGKHSPTALAEATALDALRADVPAMKDAIVAETYPARLESIRAAVEATAADAVEVLVANASALDEAKPFDKGRAFDSNTVAEYHAVTNALSILGQAAAVLGYPGGVDTYARQMKTLCAVVDIPQTERFGTDEVTLGVRALAWDVAREGDLDLVLVRAARNAYPGVTLRLASSSAEVAGRVSRADDAAIIPDPMRPVRQAEAHPATRKFV